MADNKKLEKTALGIAYTAVMKLGYTHSRLVELDEGVNYHTIRNIRDGKGLKMAIGNPRLLSQADQESWQIIRSMRKRRWALPMMPS